MGGRTEHISAIQHIAIMREAPLLVLTLLLLQIPTNNSSFSLARALCTLSAVYARCIIQEMLESMLRIRIYRHPVHHQRLVEFPVCSGRH